MARSPAFSVVLGLVVVVAGCATTGSRGAVDAARRELDGGNPATARSLAEGALATGGLDPIATVEARIVAGEAALAAGAFARADEHFRMAMPLASRPQDRTRCSRGLGDVRYRQRDFAGAREPYLTTLRGGVNEAERRELNYRLAVCARALCDESAAGRHLAAASGYRPAARDPLRIEDVACTAPPVVASKPWPSSSKASTYRQAVAATSAPDSTDEFGAASGARPQILPRSAWGAKPTKRNSEPIGRIKLVTIHHTAERFSSTNRDESARQIQGIQRHHQSTQGWADIGYHYVIDVAGRIWEGRPASVQGAHAGSQAANAGNLGIVLLGNFDIDQPSAAARASLASLVAWLQVEHRLPGTAIVTHDEVRQRFTSAGTQCPGANMGSVVESLRRRGATARASRPTAAAGTYQVQRGDTLFSIARSHGVSSNSLAVANPGVSPSTLRTGTVLVIPR